MMSAASHIYGNTSVTMLAPYTSTPEETDNSEDTIKIYRNFGAAGLGSAISSCHFRGN